MYNGYWAVPKKSLILRDSMEYVFTDWEITAYDGFDQASTSTTPTSCCTVSPADVFV